MFIHVKVLERELYPDSTVQGPESSARALQEALRKRKSGTVFGSAELILKATYPSAVQVRI